jgi:hypothetical protein
MNPAIMAQGGSLMATTFGADALFANPAGLAFVRDSTTVVPAVTTWVHSRPDLILTTIGAFAAEQDDDADDDDPVLDALTEQFTTNGFGFGTALGFSWVGNGLGFGLNVAADTFFYGETFPLGIEGEMTSQFALAIGYGHLFDLGPVQLSLGGALRPTLRISSFITANTTSDLLSSFLGIDTGEDESDGELLDNLTAFNGWGVGFDMGMMARWQPITLGVQARNIFNTDYSYSKNSLNDIISAITSGGLPAASDEVITEKYITPLEISIGLKYLPDLGTLGLIVRPSVHMEVRDVFRNTDPDPDFPRSFWTRLHAGAEVRLLNFFDARFGINQGYVTTGFGVDLGALRVNYAIYRQEYGRFPGDQPVGGAALEFALAF